MAHYFGLLVLDGQRTWTLLSNPFGADGVDLFGTYGNRVDLPAVHPRWAGPALRLPSRPPVR